MLRVVRVEVQGLLWQPRIGHLHGKMVEESKKKKVEERAEEDTNNLKSTVDWSLGKGDALSSGLKAEGCWEFMLGGWG